MAKKKVTHQAKDPNQQNHPQKTQDHGHDHDRHNHQDQKLTQPKSLIRQASMDDPAEKLQNLKSLNSMLLKEAFERRQQTETLVQAKEALETELARSGTERKGLEAELFWESEKNVCLDLEKNFLCVFLENQMGEIGVSVDLLIRENKERECEIRSLESEMNGLTASLENERDRVSKVCHERDLAKCDFDSQVKEANRLKERVFEMEKKERKAKEDILKLKGENEELAREKEEQSKAVKAAVKQRDLVGKNLEDRVNEIEGLKREIEGVVRGKKEVEKEKIAQKVKIDELEKEMGKLNEIVMSMRKEEGVLRTKVFELEKSCGEAVEKEAERGNEIDALLLEKKEKERTIEKLINEHNSTSKMLEIQMVKSVDMKREMERLVEENNASRSALEIKEKEIKDREENLLELLTEKNEVEKEKARRESENGELHKEISELRGVLSRLQESCRDHEEKNKLLISEVNHFRGAVNQVNLQRDEALKALDDEIKNGVNLMSTVTELKKRIEETAEELAQIRTERENIGKEKKDVEDQFKLLSETKDRLENDLLESKKCINDLKVKMESTTINFERALTLLKNTASLVCQSKDETCRDAKEEDIAELKLEDDIQPYAAELEAIKKAFGKKETMVQDMKRQVDFMQNSVSAAQKKKTFWTLVSSAATILAAASVAYVARGH